MLYDFLEISRTSGVPVSRQIYEGTRAAILTGKLEEGTRLPSIRVASAELGVSRTTVETAYNRLCDGGYAASRPQKGYFVKKTALARESRQREARDTEAAKYDFTSKSVDLSAADIDVWRKHVRAALKCEPDIVSYGSPRGEKLLRNALSEYSYTARGVIASPDNIIVGAGTQTLLILLCRILDRDSVIGMKSGFRHAERIFSDFGFKVYRVLSEDAADVENELERAHVTVYMDLPSVRPRTSPQQEKIYRAHLLRWVNGGDRYIIEDDYNGELKYRARPVPAMQGLDTGKIIYMGSFSKLLLPSVRIAYMALAPDMAGKLIKNLDGYNQTASKIEQLALAGYIRHGQLERHLRKLRKIYSAKSSTMLDELTKYEGVASALVLESSLAVVAEIETEKSASELKECLKRAGVLVADPERTDRGFRFELSFAGMDMGDIGEAVKCLMTAVK